jgi:protoporphyrinogen oxidase
MVENPDTIWMGAEYFCDEGDALWSLPDADLSGFAVQELDRIGVIHSADVIGTTVLRVPKAYPAYFGTFDQFPDLRSFLDTFDNLQLLGRNGMHRYNNQDHSMLTAMVAVDNILSGAGNKEDVWSVNTESDYHEKI